MCMWDSKDCIMQEVKPRGMVEAPKEFLHLGAVLVEALPIFVSVAIHCTTVLSSLAAAVAAAIVLLAAKVVEQVASSLLLPHSMTPAQQE